MAERYQDFSRDRKRRRILRPPASWGWTAASVFVGLVLAVLLLAALWLFSRPLALLVLALAIAAALAPLVSRLERRIPRLAAILLVYLLIFLVFVLIIWLILPTLIQQGTELAAVIPDILAEVQELYHEWGGDFPVVDTLFGQFGQIATVLLAVPISVASTAFEIFLVMFISLYVLVEAPKMERFLLSLFPAGRREQVAHVVQEMANAMGGFVRGTLMIAVLVGFITFLGLTIIGVRFSVVLGLIAGVLELLPYIGPLLAAIPMLLVALLESPTQALIVLVFFVILQQLESNVFVPSIMHTQTEISPLLALLAIIAGGSLGGLLGALVAIPLAAALQVFAVLVVAPMVRRQTGADRTPLVEEEDRESEKEEE